MNKIMNKFKVYLFRYGHVELIIVNSEWNRLIDDLLELDVDLQEIIKIEVDLDNHLEIIDYTDK